MAYSRSLLRWGSAPDPGVFRFALQGRPTGISHSLRLLDEKRAIPYSIAPTETSWRSSRTPA